MRDDSPFVQPDYGYESTRRPPGPCEMFGHEHEQAERFNRNTQRWEYYGPPTCKHCDHVLHLRSQEPTEHPANY